MEEDEVNTRMTGCCYVEKLNDNLVLLVWLDLNMENVKVGNLSFLEILVDQFQCLMFESISCYKSDFPMHGFNCDCSVNLHHFTMLLQNTNPFCLKIALFCIHM